VPGGAHFVVIDPTSQAWGNVVERLPLLLASVSAQIPGELITP
jgi:hypothetical protein